MGAHPAFDLPQTPSQLTAQPQSSGCLSLTESVTGSVCRILNRQRRVAEDSDRLHSIRR